ncbi:MAG: peptidylprolyl isomerase [Anaerolineae bacterium]
MDKNNVFLGMALAVALLTVGACAAPSPTPTPTPEPTATATLPAPVALPTAEEIGGPEVALTHVVRPAEEILATVNGKPVTWADYEPELVRTIHMVTLQYAVDWNDETNLAFLPSLQEGALRQVAARTLMRQLADREGVQTSPEALEAALEKERSSIFSAGMYAAWEDFLKEYGLSEAYFRRLVEDSLLVESLEEKLAPAREAEQVHVRHILVESEEKAQEVLAKLQAGEDFATLAAGYSTDPGSKDEGGDLGWFPRGVMVQEFEDAAFSAPVGEVSGPVQTSFGYHILEVLERGMRELDEEGWAQAKEQAFQDWFTAEHQKADIVYLVHFVPEAELTPEAPATPAD